MDHSSAHKNPSREACESMIKRILMTEVLEKGSNQTFRFASDFMKFFESLYPPSAGLTKQVQRAVKAMNMPKDDKGYFIVNKTTTQLDQDNEITRVLQNSAAKLVPMEKAELVFLSVPDSSKNYLKNLLLESETFQGKFITLFEASGGLVFLTENRNQLTMLLNSLTI